MDVRRPDEMFEICRNSEVMPHLGNRKPYESVEDAVNFSIGELGAFPSF
ncbi:MAG: hypothetical protein H0U50_14185 [Pyrinomonadaceae bacterium]|nr:hypothetical protein [Pyrinomonadaceae bacterium]